MSSPSSSSHSDPFFSRSLISPAVTAALPTDYTIRPLQCSDYKAGHVNPLRILTQVGDISQQAWVEQYEWMAQVPGTYFMFVVCDGEGRIAEDQQGKKLGLYILQALGDIAEKVGCYKQIVDCSAKNEGFYVQCGFNRVGSEMAH